VLGGVHFLALGSLVFGGAAWLSAQAPGELYQKGEEALRTGDLATAERDFRQVLAKDPASAGAHANLGVVYMRRKQWTEALEQLHAAEKLAPGVAGIRLNIGLTEFRRGDYSAAIQPLESVVRDQPGANQPAYILGICYFLVQRYGEAKTVLTPLWDSQSSNLQYLYVLGIASGDAGDHDLERRALAQLKMIGGQSPEMYLLIGKAHLARQEDDAAAAEFEKGLGANPKLPFAHYYLGIIKKKTGDLEAARTEFLADTAIQPDVPFNFEELGNIAAASGENQSAERYFRQALQLEPRLATARHSLAKLYKSEARYKEALAESDTASKSDDQSAALHYLRGQILQKLNRQNEARKEFAISTQLREKVRDDLELKISGESFRETGIAP
jgi:tetratricopeptide (TPR) repeat protein